MQRAPQHLFDRARGESRQSHVRKSVFSTEFLTGLFIAYFCPGSHTRSSGAAWVVPLGLIPRLSQYMALSTIRNITISDNKLLREALQFLRRRVEIRRK